GSAPFQPWLPVIRTLLIASRVSEEQLSVLNTLDLGLERLLERTIPAVPERSAASIQEELFQIVGNLINQYQKPLLIVLEDLQWAGAESLQLFNYLAVLVPKGSVLL